MARCATVSLSSKPMTLEPFSVDIVTFLEYALINFLTGIIAIFMFVPGFGAYLPSLGTI